MHFAVRLAGTPPSSVPMTRRADGQGASATGAQTTGRSDHRELRHPAPGKREERCPAQQRTRQEYSVVRFPALSHLSLSTPFPKDRQTRDRAAWTVQSEGRQTVGTSAAPHSLQSRHQSDTERPAPVHPAPRSPSGIHPRAGNLPGDENAVNPKFEVYLAYHLC